jgi:hypothetical protein
MGWPATGPVDWASVRMAGHGWQNMAAIVSTPGMPELADVGAVTGTVISGWLCLWPLRLFSSNLWKE